MFKDTNNTFTQIHSVILRPKHFLNFSPFPAYNKEKPSMRSLSELFEYLSNSKKETILTELTDEII